MRVVQTYQIFNESRLSGLKIPSLSHIQLAQYKEDEKFISDTFLDLEESGFGIQIRPDGLSDILSINTPTPYLIIDRGFTDFKFSDIKDELLQIKSYLGERWIKCGAIFSGDAERIQINIQQESYDSLDNDFQTGDGAIVNLVVFFNI